MKNLKKFYYPETLEEAVELLKNDSMKTGIVAGGTSVALSSDASTEALVDVTRLGLNHIREDGGRLEIGATATVQDLVKSETVRKYANGIISSGAGVLANRPLRNVITVGGNIVMLRIWSDLPALLMALSADVKIAGDSTRIMSAMEFFESHPIKILSPHEIVTEVSFPARPANSSAHHIKYSKTIGDYAIVSIACSLELDGGVCRNVRIVVSGANPMPCRCPGAEQELEGKEPTPDLLEKAGKTARNEVKTVTSVWATAGYRSEMIENLIPEALEECLKKLNK